MSTKVTNLDKFIKLHKTVVIVSAAVLVGAATALAAPALLSVNKPIIHKTALAGAKASAPTPSASISPSPSPSPSVRLANAKAVATKAVAAVPKVIVPSIPTSAPSVTVSQTNQSPLETWFYQYGYSTFSRMYTYFNQLNADANSPNGMVPGATIYPPVAEDCMELSGTASEAQSETPIPDTAYNAEMLTDLENINQGGTDCTQGIMNNNQTQAVNGVNQMGAGLQDYFTLVGKMVPSN